MAWPLWKSVYQFLYILNINLPCDHNATHKSRPKRNEHLHLAMGLHIRAH